MSRTHGDRLLSPAPSAPLPATLEAWQALRFTEPRRLAIAAMSDRMAAGALAAQLARRHGFTTEAAQRAAIVSCELAENLAVHGGGGHFLVECCPLAPVLRVVTLDRGPRFSNVERAFADGCTDVAPIAPEHLFGRGGIGSGLGAVRRLSRAVILDQRTDEKRIEAYLTDGRPTRDHEAPLFVLGDRP